MKLPVGGKITTLAKKFGKEMIEQMYSLPDGSVDGFVMFRAKSSPAAAIVFPLTPDNQVIAINQFRFGADELLIEIPGGNPTGLESLEETSAAELAEETGYHPQKIVVLNRQSKYWFEPASMRAWYVPVLALGCVKVQDLKLDRGECLEVKTFTLSEWMEKIKNGQITDDKTIAITTLAMLHLGYLNLKI